MPVEEQKADAGADQRAGENDDARFVPIDGGQEQGGRHDRDHTGGQPVNAVDQVDSVLQADEPEQRQGDGGGQREDDEVPTRQA